MAIYSIEGLGGVGKSTLAMALKNSNIFMIGEIFEEFPETKDIQIFTHDDENEQKTNDWFLERELIRMEKAIKNDLVVLDRCVYSQIAYNYARDKTYGKRQLPILFEKLKFYEQQGDKLFPLMVYLSASVDYSMNVMRLRAKNKELENIENKNPAYDKEFFTAMKQSYDIISEILGEKALVVNIPEIRGDLVQLVKNWLVLEKVWPEITVAKLEAAHER